MSQFRLIAPYESDARKWLRLPWQDQYKPGPKQQVSIDPADAGKATLRTYATVIDLYAAHAEPKSLGPDKSPCHRATIGLLSRRRLKPGLTAHIGKEANRIDERENALIDTLELADTLATYNDPYTNDWTHRVLPTLALLPIADIAAQTGVSTRRLRDILKCRATPRPQLKAKLTEIASMAPLGSIVALDDET